jgi:hypothetical protein
LGIEVCVQVNKTRCHKFAARINCLGGGIPRQIANLRDATVSDRKVGLYGFSACAIDKGATCNH